MLLPSDPSPRLRTLEGSRTRATLLFQLAVLAVSAHSMLLGIFLLAFPAWALRLVGWEYAGPLFWPSQAGLFLMILGVAYLLAIRQPPLAWLIIGSKAGALLFLLAQTLLGEAPGVVLLLGLFDGGMGLAVFLLLGQARAERQAQLARGQPTIR